MGTSAAHEAALTAESLKGGIYFWSPPGGIFRHDVEAPAGASELVYGQGASAGGGFGDGCVGCHALSPDGTRMAVSTDVLQSGAATVVDVSSEEQLFDPYGANAYYPSFSPDEPWVLFNRSLGNAYNDGDATLQVVASDGKGAPIALSAANGDAASANSWPRWAPFEQTTGGGERVLWFTFSSTRAYGVRSKAGQKPQLWMAAFFPDRAGAAARASSVAFRLPFQELATGNYIAQWTREVVPVVK